MAVSKGPVPCPLLTVTLLVEYMCGKNSLPSESQTVATERLRGLVKTQTALSKVQSFSFSGKGKEELIICISN